VKNMDWFMVLKAFICGGIICIIGQILIDKTKLTPARILVTFVSVGAILGGLGWYKYLIEWAGCGATVPLTVFGNSLAKGAIEDVKNIGLIGAFSGGIKSTSAGIAAAIFFGYIASIISKPKIKKQ
jgi:stage V sporulation protein AE